MDGDAFFVGCEIAKNPKLKGLPVVTGEERGIVSALSYEAKALGIKRGMPIFRIKRDFPQVLILPGDYKSYAKYSECMFEIVRRYADVVEEYSIDECFADLTGLDKPLYMSYRQIAEKIKFEINLELGLSVSIGLAPTKVLAKLASKWKKPDGLTVIEKENTYEYLKGTEIEKIWGIGRQTAEFLKRRKIFNALEFAEKSSDWIKENLSSPFFSMWLELNSVSIMQVDGEAKTEYSSVQKTRTFHPPTSDKNFLISQFSKHLEDACRKVRHYGLSARRLSFFLKSQNFRYFSFSLPLPVASNSPETLIVFVEKYFINVWREGVLYRSCGVTLSELSGSEIVQLDLFGETKQESRLATIHKQIDNLENKFGKKVLHLGSTHSALKRKVKGTDADDLDRNLLFL